MVMETKEWPETAALMIGFRMDLMASRTLFHNFTRGDFGQCLLSEEG